MKDAKSHFDQSPSQLLHRVLQIALEIYGAEVGESALTHRQYVILKTLAVKDGLSQNDLVRATGIDRSTLAELVTRMVSKGLLLREKSNLDARANLLRLSELGRNALNDAEPKVLAADAKILDLLSAPKRDGFIKLLRKIVENHDHGTKAERQEAKLAAKAAKKQKKQEKKLKKLPLPLLDASNPD